MSHARTKTSARSQPGKWRRRLLRLLVGLIIIAVAFDRLVLPGLVHQTVLGRLREIGVTEAAFDLRHVSWWRVHAADVRLGRPAWLRVGAVDAAFGRAGIGAGNPATVEVAGAQWTVRVREGAVDLGPATGGAPGPGGIEALPFGRLDIRASTLLVESESGTLRLPVEGSVVRRDGGRWRADLRIGAAGAPIALEAALNGDLDPAPADPLLGGDLSLQIAGHRIQARGVRLTAAREAVAGSSGTSVTTQLHVQEIAVAGEVVRNVTAVVRRTDGELAVEGSAEGSTWKLAVADGGAGGARWEVAGHLPAAAARRLADLGVGVGHLGRLTVAGRASVRPPSAGNGGGGGPGWRIELPQVHARLEPGDLSLRGRRVDLRGLAGDVRLAGSIGPAGLVLELREGSSLGVTGIAGPGFRSEAVRATLTPREGRALAVLGAGGEGVAAQIEFEMSVARPVSLDVGGADATVGRLTVSGHARIDGTRLEPDLRVTVGDAGVRHRRRNFEAEGISGSLRLKGLAPVSTPGGQKLLVEQARYGKLELSDGRLDFTVEGPGSVLVERAEWRMVEGTRVRAMPFRFDPAAPMLRTELYAENIALSAWLPLLTDDRATGDGTVYGRVALTVRPGDRAGALALHEGYLYAVPGRGWIQVRDASRLETFLDATEAQLNQRGYREQIKQRLVEALRDFEYWQLRVDLIDREEDVLCRIATAGRGRRGDDPQEVEELVIRIHDLNGVLNDLLSLKSAVDRAADRGAEPAEGPAPEGAEP